jgi:hypothetical protein
MQRSDTAKMMIATGGVDSGRVVSSSSCGGDSSSSSSSSSRNCSSSFFNEMRTFIQNCEELYQRMDLNFTTLKLVLKFMIRICYHDRKADLYQCPLSV